MNQMRFYQVVICFFILFLTGFFYARNALSYPMSYDDLHLIRSFTSQEIARSFFAPYDADNLETVGLRPMMVLFNHLRYELFGENVIAHRLLLIILFAIFGTTVTAISSKLESTSWKWAIVAGVLCIGAKYNVIHYVWLTDGIYLLQAVFWGFSLLLLLSALDKHNLWMYIGSLSLTGFNLLLREDTLAIIPASFFLGAYYIKNFRPESRKEFITYCFTLVVFCIAFMLYRSIVIPHAQPALGDPFGFFYHNAYMMTIAGVTYFNNISMILIYAWGFVLTGLFAVYLSGIRNSQSWKSGIWLACAISACASGISVMRVNLLLFSIMFFTVFICSILQLLATRSRIAKTIAIAIVILGMSAELYITPIIARNFHPYSSRTMIWNYEFIYGDYSENMTIPAVRRAQIVQQLKNVGVKSQGDFIYLKRKIRLAKNNEQHVPNGEKLFVPYLDALAP